MSFVHCHKCGWGQDDFYDKNYNPPQSLIFWNKFLFGEECHKLKEPFTTDSVLLKKLGNITLQEGIAQEYEKYAQRIRNMKWTTFEQFRADPNKICPKCGSGLDID